MNLKKYSHSLLLVLLFQFFLILLFFFIVFFSIFYFVERSQMEKQNIRFLTRINRAVHRNLEEKEAYKNTAFLAEQVEELAADYDIILTIISPEGRIIVDSRETYLSPGQNIHMKEINEALKMKEGTDVRYDNFVYTRYMYVATPISKYGSLSIIIRSAVPYSINPGDILNLFFQTIRLALIFIIIFLLLIIGQLKKITIPINNLSANFRKVTRGELTMTLYPSQNDYHEIEGLIHNYNDMMYHLKNVRDDLKEQKQELAGLLSSIQEGIVFIDFNGIILRANDNFCTFFRPGSTVKEIKGKHYWQLIRDSNLINKINFIKEDSETAKQMIEISYKQKYYICYVQLLKTKTNLILNFYDITDLRKLENMKKDFISNVSHELLTPLTAIKGFSETLLEDETEKTKKRHMGIILRHTERMVNIVKDLLTLAKNDLLNTGQLDISIIDLTVLAYSVKMLFSKKSEEKKVELTLDIAEGVPHIKGDKEKLEQLFINLVGNALKYTDKGTVKVKITTSGSSVQIVISDTGIGISEEDLPRIFGRFYVADKSRAKITGGTGLGLSIVRQIVSLHNGSINVKSKINAGTEITVVLPISQKAP